VDKKRLKTLNKKR